MFRKINSRHDRELVFLSNYIMQRAKPKKPQHHDRPQRKPGLETNMQEEPIFDAPQKDNKKLNNKKALITGGDSGIGRAVAVAFARHGAEIFICYLPREKKDAAQTKKYIESTYGASCELLEANLNDERECIKLVKKAHKLLGRFDILVNNAGLHYEREKLEEIRDDELLETFRVNILSIFYITKTVLPFMNEDGSVINTASVTASRGSGHLLDYAATKGAIVSFTRSLASQLVDRKIRVNAVAPGPVWTPLIVSTLDKEAIKTFG